MRTFGEFETGTNLPSPTSPKSRFLDCLEHAGGLSVIEFGLLAWKTTRRKEIENYGIGNRLRHFGTDSNDGLLRAGKSSLPLCSCIWNLLRP